MKELLNKFYKTFGNGGEVRVYSAPGRVELGGNHTDHQRGCVLAASVNLDLRAAVRKNEASIIRLMSEGYDLIEIDTNDLAPRAEERNTTSALVRGVANGFKKRGTDVSGLDMYVVSDVLRGSGLSSSAAFETLVATALSDMTEADFKAEEIAKIGQFAEREHFGKPCGLMDQMASSVGGIVSIDFSFDTPKVEKIECDLAKYGYDLVIIDAGAHHADLTDEYASIPAEMKSVAAFFGKEVLGDVSEEEFYANIADIRKKVGDRAVLRAVHFFRDTARARLQADCLKCRDFDGFLKLIRESGMSSFMYLQNIYVAGEIKNQAMACALAVCEELLCGKGAVRIQGGGFGGTLEAFVPRSMTESFKTGIDRMIGKNICTVLTIRCDGGKRVL